MPARSATSGETTRTRPARVPTSKTPDSTTPPLVPPTASRRALGTVVRIGAGARTRTPAAPRAPGDRPPPPACPRSSSVLVRSSGVDAAAAVVAKPEIATIRPAVRTPANLGNEDRLMEEPAGILVLVVTDCQASSDPSAPLPHPPHPPPVPSPHGHYRSAEWRHLLTVCTTFGVDTFPNLRSGPGIGIGGAL